MDLVDITQMDIVFPEKLRDEELRYLVSFVGRTLKIDMNLTITETTFFRNRYSYSWGGRSEVSGTIAGDFPINFGYIGNVSYDPEVSPKSLGVKSLKYVRGDVGDLMVDCEDPEIKLWRKIGDRVAEYFNTRK